MSDSNYTVNIFPLAEKDLESIYAYFFEESLEEGVAYNITTKLKEAILGLSFMPKSHPQAREKRFYIKKAFANYFAASTLFRF